MFSICPHTSLNHKYLLLSTGHCIYKCLPWYMYNYTVYNLQYYFFQQKTHPHTNTHTECVCVRDTHWLLLSIVHILYRRIVVWFLGHSGRPLCRRALYTSSDRLAQEIPDLLPQIGKRLYTSQDVIQVPCAYVYMYIIHVCVHDIHCMYTCTHTCAYIVHHTVDR